MGALGGGLAGLVSEGRVCAAVSLSTNRFCPGGLVPLLVCLLKRLQWQASFGYNLGLKFHTWNVNLISFRVGELMGISVAAIAPRSSVDPFRSICVMYVKCCSLVRYRPYILSGTLLFNRRSLPAEVNYYYYYYHQNTINLKKILYNKYIIKVDRDNICQNIDYINSTCKNTITSYRLYTRKQFILTISLQQKMVRKNR